MPELTVIADGRIKAAVERAIEALFTLEEDLTIVYAESTDTAARRSQYGGIDKVVELAPQGHKIILASMTPSVQLSSRAPFQVAMSYPNVLFVDALRLISDLRLILGWWKLNSRPENLLARRVFSHPSMQMDVMGVIRHDLGHAQRAEAGSTQREEMDRRWIPLAQTLFGDLNREALIAAIELQQQQNGEPNFAPFQGESYNVVCCDVEGTLIGTDGTFNDELFADLKKLGDSMPIVLWTGGDIKAVGKKLQEAGVSYPLVPKGLLRGVTVSHAIDDLPEEEFTSTYGITAEKYQRI